MVEAKRRDVAAAPAPAGLPISARLCAGGLPRSSNQATAIVDGVFGERRLDEMSAGVDEARLNGVLRKEQGRGAARRDEKDRDVRRLRELHGDVQWQALSLGRGDFWLEIVVLAKMSRPATQAAGEHGEQQDRT